MQDEVRQIPEKWLVEAMNSRIPERFGEVYDRFVPQIYRNALFRLGDKSAAEDVAGDTFLRAWNYLIRSPERIENPRAFLSRIAHNLITDHYRKRSHDSVSLEEVPEHRLPPADQGSWHRTELQTVRKEIRHALQSLEEDYRDLVVWRYIDELSVEEIVTISGKSANAVYVSLHRALKKLRVVLEDRGLRDI